MSITLNKDEYVVKAFNNNIILVNSSEQEKILFAKGIGFSKKMGDIVPKGTLVDKVFTIENKENISNLEDIIKIVDNEFFAVCEEAILQISNELNTELNERIHIGLVDHLFLAVKRLKEGKEVENPFLIETKTLYEREYSLAGIVADKIGNYSNIEIPDGEIAFIALHIHSALNDGKISNTLKNTYLNNEIVEYVEQELGIEINKNSIDYARFCTHVKFAIQRIMNNSSTPNGLRNVIKNTYKQSYLISEGVSKIIERELHVSVSDDEIAFITIHIERFRENKQIL